MVTKSAPRRHGFEILGFSYLTGASTLERDEIVLLGGINFNQFTVGLLFHDLRGESGACCFDICSQEEESVKYAGSYEDERNGTNRRRPGYCGLVAWDSPLHLLPTKSA